MVQDIQKTHKNTQGTSTNDVNHLRGAGGTEKMTEVDAPWGKGRGGGRSEKVDVNHPRFFDRYSRSIEQ